MERQYHDIQGAPFSLTHPVYPIMEVTKSRFSTS